MSTPTIGELERRIADLEARGEEWDEEIGMADDEPEPYEGDVDEVEIHFGKGRSWEATHLCSVGCGIRAYVDSEGDYWVTTHNILEDGGNGVCVGDPDKLRILADKIEGAER